VRREAFQRGAIMSVSSEMKRALSASHAMGRRARADHGRPSTQWVRGNTLATPCAVSKISKGQGHLSNPPPLGWGGVCVCVCVPDE
jgi:hypothetical protein